MGTGGIYEIVNTVNGKRYIGSAVNFKRRWRAHRHELKRGDHHSIALQRAWDRYGEAVFKFLPMMTVEDTEKLVWWEQRFFDALEPEYNACRTAGSVLGYKHTNETKKKISKKSLGNTYAKGYRHSLEARAEMSEARKGRQPTLGHKHTLEAKANMSRAGKGKSKSPAHCAAISAGQIGRKMSEKTKNALLVANVGRHLSDEHKDKLRVLNTGKVMSPDAIERSVSKRRGRKVGPQSAELIERRVAPLRGKKQSEQHVAKRVKARRLNASYKRLMQVAWAGA